MSIVVCLESPGPGRASRQALRLALRIGHPVTVLCAGHDVPPELSAAVEKAVFVKGSALLGADHLTRGLVLAEACRRCKPALILAGTTSDCEGRGLVPAAIAHHLRVPILAGAQDVLRNGDEFAITLLSEGQRVEVNCQGPLVVAVAPSWTEHLVQEETPVSWQEISLADLELDESRLLRRPDMLGDLEPPPVKAEVVDIGTLLARWLRS